MAEAEGSESDVVAESNSEPGSVEAEGLDSVEMTTQGADGRTSDASATAAQKASEAMKPMMFLRGSGPQFSNKLFKTSSAYHSHDPSRDMCLAVDGNKIMNGAKLQVWDCLPGGEQRFTLDAYGRLHWASSPEKCVVVDGDSHHNGARIQLWDCNYQNQHQKWIMDFAYGRIRWAEHPEKCMVTDGDRDRRGTKVQLWDCNSYNSAQQWCLSDGYPCV